MATDYEQFTKAPGRDELIKEVRARIDQLGIQYLYLQFVSVTGRVMGKGIPADHWENVANGGFQLVYGATVNLSSEVEDHLRWRRHCGHARRQSSVERPARAAGGPTRAAGGGGQRAQVVISNSFHRATNCKPLVAQPSGPRWQGAG